MNQENGKFAKQKYTILTVAMCLTFIACSLLLLVHMVQKNEEENVAYLYNAANQSLSAINGQIQGDFQTLDGIAACIGEMDQRDGDQIMPVLRRINDGNDFIRMGFASPNGQLDLVDMGGKVHQDYNVFQFPFFQDALQGKKAVSGALQDSLAPGKYIIYYAVQVCDHKGNIVGVLCAVNSTDRFRKIIDAPILDGTGFSEMIDIHGKLVFPSGNSSSHGAKVSLNSVDPADLSRITQAMGQGKPVDFAVKVRGKDQLAVLQPLGVNDWHLLTMVPKEALRKRYMMTAYGISAIIFLASVIFFLLLAQQRRIITKNHEALMHLAYTDPITGCRNYARFKLDVQMKLKKNRALPYAFWYCDLKKFKYYNDVFGYDRGDVVLRHMAQMIRNFSGSDAIFCRVSADNYAGLKTYGSKEELVEWFQNLLDFHKKGWQGMDRQAHFDICMGFYCMEEGDEKVSVDTLVNRANMAQKSAKALPGSSYTFYDREIRDQVVEESQMEDRAEAALGQGEFKLYVQPKVNIQEGNRIGGGEVLVRWLHPSKGMLPPDKFISLFEKNGMIVKLDRYVFQQACRWLKGYLEEGRQKINLAVNVSRLGLLKDDFIDYYASVKEACQIPDGLLELEFTESMALKDDEMFLGIIKSLQQHGFICSMDDFGSGYSSLNLLKDLPINVLKLDILFFRKSASRERERIVVSNVINMARQLHIKTIAEGVESPEVVEFLRKAGCDLVQGYVFSRPMPLEEFDQMLAIMAGGPFTPYEG